MRIFPVFLALVVGAALFYWVVERDAFYSALGIDTQPDEPVVETATDTGEDDSGAIKVVAMSSVAQDIDTGIVLRGQTEAVRAVDIRAETSATVVSEPIRKGSFVEAGQSMCVLDEGTRGSMQAEAKARLSEAKSRKSEAQARVPEAQARVAEAQARLDEALNNENTALRLSEDGYASDSRLKNERAMVATAQAALEAARAGVSAAQSGIDSAQAGIESAEAAVAAANKEIERLTIRAPFAGVLESDTAELGSLLQPGGLCATILQLDPMKLVAFVPETEISRVKPGAVAGARLAGSDGLEVTGTVDFLSRRADMTTRTFRVEITVPNPDLAIRDGQTAEILISAAGETAHLLPASAMTLNDEGTLGIRAVAADNTVVFHPVTMLRDTAQGVWLGGLPDTVDVIVVGQEFVTQGVPVAVTYREAKS